MMKGNKMKLNRKEWKVLVVGLALVLITGCASWFMIPEAGDPNEPNDIVLSPTGQKIESGLETGADVAKGVSIYWPPATLIAGALTTLGLALRKYKPEIAKLKTQKDTFYTVTSALVFAIEKLKEDYPEDWEKHLEPILSKNIDPNGSIEAVIRALRGMPAKS